MKHTKLFLSLLTLFTFNIGNICSETYVLDFTQKSASSASYTNSWTWTTTDGNYTLTNASNYNKQWSYVKFGGKGGTKANSLKKSYSSIVTPKFANATNKLVVTSNNAAQSISNFTLETMVLTIAKDAKFTNVIDEVSTTTLSNVIEFSPNENKEWSADSYYKLTINWTIKGKNNIGLQIEKLAFTQETGIKETTLYLIPNGGTLDDKTDATNVTLPDGVTTIDLTKYTPTREHYDFEGWYTEETGGTKVGGSYTPEANATTKLYAHWIEHPKYVITSSVSPEGAGTIVLSATQLYAGQSFTATATANDDYMFASWSITGEGATPAKSTDNPVTITIGSADVQVTANFREKPKHTITWISNGRTYKETQVVDGGVMVLPDAPSVAELDCANAFVGWSENLITGMQQDAPTDLFNSVDKTSLVSADKTFYAVFATKDENSIVFDPNAVTSNTNPVWKDEKSGVELKLSAGQLYTGSPKTFTITAGTSNYFTISSPVSISTIMVGLSGEQYCISSVEGGTLETNSTSQTIICGAGVKTVKCSATKKNQIRITKIEVQTYTDYATQCTPTYSITLSDKSVGVVADESNPTKVLETATSLTLKYTAAEYHTLPENISVSMGGTDLAESAYKWDKETGILTITTSFNGDIAVTIAAVATNVAPTFTTDLDETEVTYNEGDEAATLKVVAIGYPEPTYQWYSNSTNSTEGAVAIENAKEATYTPSTSKIGTTYYYCVATNDAGKATSKIATIKVNKLPQYTVTFHVKDKTYSVPEITPNGGVAQPTETPETIGDYTFAGWSTIQIAEETTEQPNYVALTENNKYYPTADIDLYAVYTAKKNVQQNGYIISVPIEKDGIVTTYYLGNKKNSTDKYFSAESDRNNALTIYNENGFLFYMLSSGKRSYFYNDATTSNTSKTDLIFGNNATKAWDVTTENEVTEIKIGSRYLAYNGSGSGRFAAYLENYPHNLTLEQSTEFVTMQVSHYTSLPSDMVTPTITFDNLTTSVTVDKDVTNVATTTSTATITYSSSNEDVATVDADGKVTGHKYGTATITASVAEVPDKYYAASASYDINVQCITTTISFLVDGKEAKSATVYAHNTYKFDVKTNTDAEIKYSLANTSYAETTGEAGEVKISPFTGNITTSTKSATLYARADQTEEYTSAKSELKLTIKDNRTAQFIELEEQAYTFDINTEVAPFTNTITNTEDIKGELSYSSSNPAIAEINDKGEVTVHSSVSGTATITVTAAEKEQVYDESQKAYFDYQEATAQYTITINYPKPTFSLAEGEYHTEIISEIKAEGAEYIYYTTSGTTLIWDADNLEARGEGVVGVASKDFPAVVTFDKVGNHVVKALAVYGEDFVASPVAEVAYDLVAPSLKYSWTQGEVVDANTDLTITTDVGAKITYILSDANNNMIASGDDLDKEAIFRITSMGTYTLSVVSQWDDQDDLKGLGKDDEFIISVKGPATLPFAYNGSETKDNLQPSDMPLCFTTNMDEKGYSPSNNKNTQLKFGTAGTYLTLEYEAGLLAQLSYSIKFNGTTTAGKDCEFKVQTSVDNKTWIDAKTYKGANCIPTEETSESIDITDHHVHYIKWVYTTKDGGNVGLGNINLIAIPMEIEAKEDIPSDYHGDVVVKDGATPTITDATQLNSLTIENGGKVTLSNTLEVNDFYINTTMGAGKSGQMIGATNSNFSVQGDAYIDITLGKNGDPNQWHAFTVPFPVDAMNGVYDLDNNKLTNGVNYAVMDYHGDIRAKGQYGWKKYRGILNPGTFYLMTVDGERSTYRFKKTGNSALVANNEMQLREYAANGEGADTDAGWNGVGNMTLAYGKANIGGITGVQVLNPETYTYEVKQIADVAFTVGTPFFVQAAADGVMSMEQKSGSILYAPAQQAAKTTSQYDVHFGNADYTDVLYISASEDATNTYQIGKDLVKMTMSNAPVVPQILAEAYDNLLCVMHAPLSNDETVFPLNLYAPKAGEYTISTGEVQGETIYLMQGDKIIWNLTLGEYTLDLEQGNHKGYSILLKAPHVTTDFNPVMNGNSELVEKVFLHNNLYIIRGGKMYDAIGKMVQNK